MATVAGMIRLALALLLAASPAAAADMTFFMKNDFSRGVAIELFGQDTGTRWPGGDQVFFLDKGERKSVPIECRAGENICYGAWVNGNDRVFWGVGPDNNRACDTCCVICVEKATETILIE